MSDTTILNTVEERRLFFLNSLCVLKALTRDNFIHLALDTGWEVSPSNFYESVAKPLLRDHKIKKRFNKRKLNDRYYQITSAGLEEAGDNPSSVPSEIKFCQHQWGVNEATIFIAKAIGLDQVQIDIETCWGNNRIDAIVTPKGKVPIRIEYDNATEVINLNTSNPAKVSILNKIHSQFAIKHNAPLIIVVPDPKRIEAIMSNEDFARFRKLPLYFGNIKSIMKKYNAWSMDTQKGSLQNFLLQSKIFVNTKKGMVSLEEILQ